jgi:hypothetical protein
MLFAVSTKNSPNHLNFNILNFLYNLLKKLLHIAAILAFPTILMGQPYVDVLNLKAQYFPAHPSTGAEGSDSLSVKQYEAAFLVPLEQKNKDVILIGGDYYSMNFDYTGTPNGKTTLHSASMAVGYERQLKNPDWKVMALVIPKFNSDFEKNTTDDFQLGGAVLTTLKKSDSLKFHFGLYYNREFFGNYFMPLLGIDWKINSRFSLFGDLPANLNLEYKVCRKFYTGVAYASVVSSYRLESGNYVREGDKFWGYDQFKIYFNYYITKNIVWFGEAGTTFGRMYRVYNNDDVLQDGNPVLGEDIDGPLFNTGLALRFRLDEK